MGNKRKRIPKDDPVIRALLKAMTKSESKTKSYKPNSSKTISYNPDTMLRRNNQRRIELNYINRRFTDELAPEMALMDMISEGIIIPTRRIHKTHSQRSARRNDLRDIGHDLRNRQNELQRLINEDDEIFDEVNSPWRP
jgi:hypothetical protein